MNNQDKTMTFQNQSSNKTNSTQNSSFAKAMRALQEKLQSIKKEKEDLQEELDRTCQSYQQYEKTTESEISEQIKELEIYKATCDNLEENNRKLIEENVGLKDEYQKLDLFISEVQERWELDRTNFTSLEAEWVSKEEDYKISLRDMEFQQKKLSKRTHRKSS